MNLQALIEARDAAYARHCACDPEEPIPAEIKAACSAADDALQMVCPHLMWYRMGPRSDLEPVLRCECCGLEIALSRWYFVLDKPCGPIKVGDHVLVNGEGDTIFVIREIDGQSAWLDDASSDNSIGWKALKSIRKWVGAVPP